MFANRYLPQAPDLGDNYLVWIARYGEYKPNIKPISAAEGLLSWL